MEGKEESLPMGMKLKMNNFRNLLRTKKILLCKTRHPKTILFIAQEVAEGCHLGKNAPKVAPWGKGEEGQERLENIKELAVWLQDMIN